MSKNPNLVSDSVKNIINISEHLGALNKDNNIRILLTIYRSILSLFVSVPAGVKAKLYKNGQSIRTLEPGFHFLPKIFGWEIKLINIHYIIFKRCVNCKTSDEISFAEDIMCEFRITDVDKITNKFINIDKFAADFNSKLTEEIDLITQNILCTVHSDNILYLGLDKNMDAIKRLQQAFIDYGIDFYDFKFIQPILKSTELSKFESKGTLATSTLAKEDEVRKDFERNEIEYKDQEEKLISDIDKKISHHTQMEEKLKQELQRKKC